MEGAGEMMFLVALVLSSVQSTWAADSSPPTSPPRAVNQSVCYKTLGCYDNFYPWNNTKYVLPNPPELVGTAFWLYTREHRANNYTLQYDDGGQSVRDSNYDSIRPLKMVIHGFSDSGITPWVTDLKEALLTQGDYNVVVVQWGRGSRLPDYPQAVANTRLVAKQISLLLNLLISQSGLQLSDVHMIGHSLGAHVSGYVGASFKGNIGRISGLDPAEPSFQYLDEVVRLNKEDAQFVDVIHSNAAPIGKGGAGLYQASGHVDFYPNGGLTQPGCPALIEGVLGSIFNGKAEEIGKVASCSHSRSYAYYTESLLSDRSQCTFTSYPCSNYDEFSKGNCFICSGQGCSEMGFYSDQSPARGTLYLTTTSSPKYCGNAYVLRLDTAQFEGTDEPIKGELTITLTGFKSQMTGIEEKVTVQLKGEYDELAYGTTYNPVVIHTHLDKVTQVQIMYTHYGGLLFGWNAGVKSFTLTNVSLIQQNSKWYSCASSGSKLVQTGKTFITKLC